MMQIGHTETRAGDVTSLNFVAARPPALIERTLGFAPGRLGRGYWLLLLLDMVGIDDFRLGGFTLLSGGRDGLPAATWEADKLRPAIHDRVVAGYDDQGRKLRQIAAAAINRLTGPQRTMKVVPLIGHDPNIGPASQYPQGLGAPQWTLIQAKRFLVAGQVDAMGRFTGRGVEGNVAATAAYDDRARVAHYLEKARV